MVTGVPGVAPHPSRVLGHVRGHEAGRTVILVAGLHGNEPAGVEALQRVFRALPGPEQVRGEVLGLAGNPAALERGTRYIDEDLNRGWWPDTLSSPAAGPAETSESRDRQELLAVMRAPLGRAGSPPIVVDFHTTSGETPPFITLGDTLRNRRFATAVPLPVVLGVEEQLAATFLEYMSNRGCCITLGCEGGRHGDPAAVDYMEAVAWIALIQAGVIDPEEVPPPDPRAFLNGISRDYPSVVEVRHRHAVPRAGEFTMYPGFRSFQRVAAGEPLGEWDDGRTVRAPESGRVLMPLYQSQGDDGFF
nr:succinylglutamate desuccinylase/aspartoacylase family protein [Gemmatimonadota bacterium]NIX43099.1 hypothetical protein [Gemmatimonadota bacterium]